MPGRLVGQSVDTQGPAGLPAGAADARAAHPPRQGDLQHLHGAGAARQHGDGLRDLARAGGPAGDRRARPWSRRAACRRARRPPASPSPASEFFDTVTVTVEGGAQEIAAEAEKSGRLLRVHRRRPRRHQLRRDLDRGRPAGDRGPVRRDGLRSEAAVGCCPARRARQELPDAAGLPREPLRNRDDALPAAAGRQGSGARPRHDPARLLHDEAQRRGRDDAGELAERRQHASVRAGRACRRLPRR